ncbi:MAG TPA: alpha/beta hydrolase [Kofleriaceae bacterium]|jgi:pimeloyl-ACP methyl ester carboxylesterase|nr:alpha/beta hydrolase [Kofleriaceae bacterium]
MSRSLPPVQSFTHAGRRIAYRVYGDGPRLIVLTHGLLMDMRMYTALAPALAARGNKVITVDMLGHGASDQPHDMHAYTMSQFGKDVIALLDHLGVEQAVLGGTSLGANIALEAADLAPERVRALVIEMPVLEHAIVAAAAVFVPLALAIRISQRAMSLLAWLTRKIPRTHFLLDVAIDFVRRDPRASLAVLDGLTFGRIAPPRALRLRLTQPALVIGHERDPVHAFSDADTMARELPNARLLTAESILEWRLRPARLDGALADFLDEVWQEPLAVAS